MATGFGTVFAARMVDPGGKGRARRAARCVVAEIAPPEARGAALGCARDFDSRARLQGRFWLFCSCFCGPGISSRVLVGRIPGALSVLLLAFLSGSRHPEQTWAGAIGIDGANPPTGKPFAAVLVMARFSHARFSEAFLLLHARKSGHLHVSTCRWFWRP
jgi:hypothetical protein